MQTRKTLYNQTRTRPIRGNHSGTEKKQTDMDGYAAEPDKPAGMGGMIDGGQRTDDQNSDGDKDTNDNLKKRTTLKRHVWIHQTRTGQTRPKRD